MILCRASRRRAKEGLSDEPYCQPPGVVNDPTGQADDGEEHCLHPLRDSGWSVTGRNKHAFFS